MDVEMDSFIVETSSEGEIKPSPMLVDPIYLSSDSEEEEMCTFTTGSWADDEDGLSDELQSMSVNNEHALYTGIPTRPTYAGAMVTPPPTPRRQLFQPESFNFDMGRGWIGDERKNHPIELCREIVPIRDSPASPDTPNRKPEIFRPYDLPGPSNREEMQRDQTVDLVSGHLENIRIAASSAKPMYSDCIVCGKSYGDIVVETVRNYLQRTAVQGESDSDEETRRVAFIAGIEAGTFMFVPRGLSQAAACDGNLYTMNTQTAIGRALPGTLPFQ